jgi:hypothetical protein
MTWPADFVRIAADNNQQPFATAADFLGFAQGAAAAVTGLDDFTPALWRRHVECPYDHGILSRYGRREVRELNGTAGNRSSSPRSVSRMC